MKRESVGGKGVISMSAYRSCLIWQYTSLCFSCSIPAPLFYTEDDIPDLVIRTNEGAWPEYNVSTVRVLDGSDGSLLWTFNSAHSGMMSSISVVSETHGRDALVFLTVGAMKDEEDGSRDRRSRPLEEEEREGHRDKRSHPLDQDGTSQGTYC